MPPSLPELPGVAHRFLDLPTGVRAHVAEAGPPDAPAVLCLHGWPQHWWAWRRVIPLMDAGYRLVCPDLRGFGWSGPPADGDFAKQRLADDALALLDQLGLDRVDVMGHDWGGWAAILLGLRAPDRVRHLLIMGIAHPWQPLGRVAKNAWRLGYQVPLALPVVGPAVVRDGRFVRMMLRGGWADKRTFDEAAAALYLAAVREQAEASSRLYRTFLARETLPGLRGAYAAQRLRMPTRLLFGRRDALGPVFAEGLERHADDGAVELIDDCGHFVPEERPDLVASRGQELFGRRTEK
jgi:pimeloyl-ACP methyl ester carboxylesterase